MYSRALSETLLIAWRRRADWPPDDPVPWVFGIARNLIRSRHRADRRTESLRQRLEAVARTAGPVVEPVESGLLDA